MAVDVELSISTIDFNGKEKQTLLFFPSTLTVANLVTYMAAYQPLHEAVSSGFISKAVASFNVLGTPTSGALPAVRINEAARFAFNTPGRFKFGVYIPAINPELVNVDEIILDDTRVTDWAAALTTGLGGFVPVDGHSVDVGTLKSGKFALLK